VDAQQRPASLPPQSRVGQTLNGKWTIERLIDVGGMGAVYVACHRNGRKAALKLLHAHLAYHPEIRTRFLREGYVANRIGHPGAVAVLDDDIAEDGSPFLVMELLEGESLSQWLSRAGGKLQPAEALAIGGQVLEVLAAAHKNGVVHRDIKPGNIFVTKAGHAKLLDFGLARVRDAQATTGPPTAMGTVMGTAGYMPPEQARGRQDEIDARSDIYAMGAVLFRAITGRRVHERDMEFDVTLAAMKDRAPSLALVLPGAAPALVAAIDRALSFEKGERWQSAEDMFRALGLAYEELQRGPNPPGRAVVVSSREASTAGGVADETGSLVIEVTFGSIHDTALARERARTLEVIDELSSDSQRAEEG